VIRLEQELNVNRAVQARADPGLDEDALLGEVRNCPRQRLVLTDYDGCRGVGRYPLVSASLVCH
jgi:hypothetical protein